MDGLNLLASVALGISGLCVGLYIGLSFRHRFRSELTTHYEVMAHVEQEVAQIERLKEIAAKCMALVDFRRREAEQIEREINRERERLLRFIQAKVRIHDMDPLSHIADQINDILREITPSSFPADEAWERWKKSLGLATHERQETEKLSYKLWQEAGSPEGQQDHFWDMAEQQLVKRTLGEKGISGACMTDKELAKQTATEQFIRRRKAAIRDGQIDNSSLRAGMPMIFYCKCCGIMIETLPEDFLFSPRKRCSQCKGLAEMNWLQQAMITAASAGLEVPTPQRWVPNEARKEDSEATE